MKQKIIVIVSVLVFFLLLILLIGFLLGLGFNALLDLLFTTDIKDGFTEDLVNEIRQDWGVSIPADAEFIYGKRYSGEDYSIVIGFYMPFSSETIDPAAFVRNTLLLQPEAWTPDTRSRSNAYSPAEKLPDLVGGLCLQSETLRGWIDYSTPTNGKIYIRLYFSTV